VLTIIDTFSHFSPAIEPRFTFRGPDVVEILEQAGRQVGFLKAIRVDQGSEFVSRDVDLWAYQRGVTLDFSRPESPLTMPSLNRSMANSVGMFERALVHEPRRCAPKVRGLAQRLQSHITTPICLCDWRKEVLLIGMASRGVFRTVRGALS
jgi:hypothetical protein